jgi:hypothetical protein
MLDGRTLLRAGQQLHASFASALEGSKTSVPPPYLDAYESYLAYHNNLAIGMTPDMLRRVGGTPSSSAVAANAATGGELQRKATEVSGHRGRWMAFSARYGAVSQLVLLEATKQGGRGALLETEGAREILDADYPSDEGGSK